MIDLFEGSDSGSWTTRSIIKRTDSNSVEHIFFSVDGRDNRRVSLLFCGWWSSPSMRYSCHLIFFNVSLNNCLLLKRPCHNTLNRRLNPLFLLIGVTNAAANDPAHGSTTWLDRFFWMGEYTKDLIPQCNCPTESVYLPATLSRSSVTFNVGAPFVFWTRCRKAAINTLKISRRNGHCQVLCLRLESE